MKGKGFIIAGLKEMIIKFPMVKASYRYMSATSMHIVEILPKYVHKETEFYVEFEMDLTMDFEDKNFGEELLIITEGFLNYGLRPNEEQYIGKDYKE